jgi:hypothetical protein
LYNELKKPKMWIDNDYLYLLVPGRCAAITKTKLGQPQFKECVFFSVHTFIFFVIEIPIFSGVICSILISTVWQAPFYPAQTDERYVSSADLDPSTGVIFYSLQDYNRRDRSTVSSIDMRNFVPSLTADSLSKILPSFYLPFSLAFNLSFLVLARLLITFPRAKFIRHGR